MNINKEFPIPEMVERVAKAIWLARCVHTMRTAGIELEIWGEDSVVPIANGIMEEARAAIEAMREPTKAMIAEITYYDTEYDQCTDDMATEQWQKMIEAALMEPEK